MWRSSDGHETTPSMAHGEQTELSETRLWSADEHLRFLDGLEMYGQHKLLHPQDETRSWALIASYVKTRSEAETKEHGERYLHALLTQSLVVSKQTGCKWTPEEDKQFENALAEWIHTPHAWTKIAMQLPGKTVYDVMDRYDALVRDLTAIENGEEPESLTDVHETNMALIASIAKANDNHVLYDVFKEAYDNPCSMEIATYVASAVVGMVASNGQDVKRAKAPGKKPVKVKKSPRKKLKMPKKLTSKSSPWDGSSLLPKKCKPRSSQFSLPPLEGKIPPGLMRHPNN
ncbi:unnamed protein product [Aphanomyces euteiches]|uniref:Myb-like domain-containing protein n=1 Tax=Aphanomyces euteiches TaxID=100861 RepID=A0A6G0WW47_9STRA|nr:hypothetical protein Ae201684_011014 [Aphanomyces euteiches]KAH9058514.1 hypothetical protein Ae201684P_005857 [Aphanomyces euteiches]KAH9145687.1 hypothetical protein AeRB84_010398 [Aphanomyces euteiches]